MRRVALLVGALGAGFLLGGCAQSQQQSWMYREPFPENRAELYRQYGPPDAIRVEVEDRWLRYDHSERKGMTLGARYYLLGLVIGRSQSAADRLWVKVAPDERITEVDPAVNTDQLHYRFWPFGD
jgi:hypothetical protein